MITVYCDKCRAEIIDSDAPDGALKICVGIDWNSSWEQYGQFVYCPDCVVHTEFLNDLVHALDQ